MRRLALLALVSSIPLAGCAESAVGPGPEDANPSQVAIVDLAPVAAVAQDGLLWSLVREVEDPGLRSALDRALTHLGAAAADGDVAAIRRAARSASFVAAVNSTRGLSDADQQALGAVEHALGHVRWLVGPDPVAP